MNEDRPERPTNESAGSPSGPPAWFVFALLLSLEYLAVSALVDVQDVLRPAGFDGLEGLGTVAVLVFLVVATTFVTGGAATLRALGTLTPLRSSLRATLGFGGVHALAVGALFLVLGKVVGATDVASARCLLVALGILGGLVVASALATFYEGARLRSAFLESRRALGIGTIVGLLAWGAGLGASLLWEPLGFLTLELVHALLTVLAPDPVASVADDLVGTSRFYVHVAPVCSGVEGIGLMLAFVGAFLFLERTRLRWPRALILLPVSALAVWLLNVLRITALIAIGTWGSPKVALGGFHSKAGWLLFTVAALGAVLLVRDNPAFLRAGAGAPGPSSAPRKEASRVARSSDVEAAYLLPLLVVLGISLGSGLLATESFDPLYPLRVIGALGVLYRFRTQYPSLRPRGPWSSSAVGAFVGALWLLGVHAAAPASEHWGAHLATLSPLWATLWLAFRLFGAVVCVPIVEELAFRGFLLRRVSSRDFEEVPFEHSSWLGLVISSVAFGALHSEWALGIFAGFVFGGLARHRGRLADAVVAHAVANAVLAAYGLTTGDWRALG